MRIILNQMNFENRLNDQELDEYKKFMSIYKEDEKLQYSMEHKVDNIIGVITAIGVMIVFALLLMLCNIYTEYFSPKMKISVTYATREDGDVLDKNIIVTFNGVKRNCKAKIPSFDLCTGFVTLPVDETGEVKR